jgi:outer membrane biosynthesis protein TonB
MRRRRAIVARNPERVPDVPRSNGAGQPSRLRRGELATWSAVVVASVGLHAVAFGGLGGGGTDGRPTVKKVRPPSLVELSVASAKEAAPLPPAPRPSIKAPPRATMARPARIKAAPAVPPPPSAAPPPAAEALADFTGVTLTNDGPGAAWSSATGNGEAMRGAVGRPGARVTRRNIDGNGADIVRHPGPPVVAAADLSRPPVAPDLTAALARAYPSEARTKGIAGKAVIHARIQPDGRVADMKLISETAAGFGAACQSTLRGSTWSPPVDRQARTVATYINYTCRFEVQ